MSLDFGVQKQAVYGTYGEFTIESDYQKITAQYLLTKMKPGAEGSWENKLASQMVPWREIFTVEELTFDELLQRDLDDSRVANDLIPYLLGESGSNARFFPPILAVIAPHRTINKDWKDPKYASYYNHLQLSQNQIKNLELPVCIVFFPDLHENNQSLKAQGIDLKSVCREIFIVVNKNAKRVSYSRELLLDDEDLAARMMRNTLSQLKERNKEDFSLARIYSFAFGDSLSDADTRVSEVVTGELEYSSAVALHKIHCAISFGMKDAFLIEKESKDITHKRRVNNKERCETLLKGTELADKWQNFKRNTGKYHPLAEVQLAVNYLGNLTDIVILPLFDQFIPFAVYNHAMREVYTQLQNPLLRTEEIQIKSFNLLFEGSAVQAIFEDHRSRLKDRINELKEENKPVSDYLSSQLEDAEKTIKAVENWEDKIKLIAACKLFSIDTDQFLSNNSKTEEKELKAKARSIFDAISTQAFQLAYPMTIHSVVELMIKDNKYTSYQERLRITKFIAELYLTALNQYFSSKSDTLHRSLTGFITESRVNIFNPSELGLRGLLSLSIKELNESQWTFFRYAILEIAHCKHGYQGILDVLSRTEHQDLVEKYQQILPSLIDSILQLRQEYIKQGINSNLNSKEFKNQLELNKAQLKGKGLLDSDIKQKEEEIIEQKRQEIKELAQQNIKASLGEISDKNKLIERLNIAKNLGFTSGIAGGIDEFI
jgi:adenylate kinase family enzyme